MKSDVQSMSETATRIFETANLIVEGMPDGSRKQIKDLAAEVSTSVGMEPKVVLGFVNFFAHQTKLAYVTRGKHGGLIKGVKPIKMKKPDQQVNMSASDQYKKTYESTFKKIESKDARKLWVAGYYDGPLSGMCLVDGEKCWFDHLVDYPDEHPEFYDEDNDDTWADLPWGRRYLVWKLTPEQIENLEYNHSFFQKMVGTHMDCDENGNRKIGQVYSGDATPETLKKYYKEVSPTLVRKSVAPATEDMIIGWYEV